MRALTGNEVTILKSRFQAGPNAHRQQVKLTAQVAAAPVATIRNPHFPWVVQLANGEAGMLYRADFNMSGGASMRVFFHRYLGQHILGVPVELFPYDTAAYGLVNYRGKLIAACWNPTTLAIRYRSSSDSGITWSAEATLLPGVETTGSAGKTYTKSVAASGSYPDTGGIELTDGNLGHTTGWNTDGSYSGYNLGAGGVLDVRVDQVTALTSQRFRVYTALSASDGIVHPTSVEIFTSPDDVTYTSIGTAVRIIDSGIRHRWELLLANAVAVRYIRYRITCGGAWLFVAEVEATGTPPVTLAANEVGKNGGHVSAVSFQLATSKDGLTLYLFYVAPWSGGGGASTTMRYRRTVAVDPTTGWTGDTASGFTIPSLGRNYGGASAYNQGHQRGFIVCETKTAGTWVVASEADDGAWQANHMAAQGTLGGTWTRTLNAGHGGGLSGKQGANGGVFRDRNGEVVFYVMDDEGVTVDSYLSTTSGASWGANKQLMPAGGAALKMGGGSGAAISGYDSVEYIWGHVAGGGTAIGVTHYGDGTLADWGLIYGVGAAAPYVTFTPSIVDVSDRVISISEQKDRDAAAGAFSIELRNNDRALSVNDTGATLYAYSRANVKVEIWQWHGVVANIVKTFTGIIDSVSETADGMRVTISGRDYAKKLIVQEVVTTASQDLPDGVRDMGNYVYLNKTLVEVLADLLSKASVAASTTLTVSPTSYVFREFRVSSGSLMDAAVRAAELAGMRFWADEDGNFVAAPHYGPAAASVWTYRAYEDAHLFDSDLSDDNLATRVRVIGKANIGAKYLTQQFIWASGGDDPRGIAYDATTGHVWIMHANRWLARLNPAANMAVVASWDLSGIITYPDSIAVDPDGHLWIADGFDATLTPNANRRFRKVDRTTPTTTLLGPFTNPGQLHVRLWHDGTNLRMATYASPAQLVTVTPATGVDTASVVSPVNFPMGYDTDGQGGAFITGWESVDMYQITLAGSIVNTIQQPAKNSNEFGYDSSDGGLYAVYSEHDTIVKYAVGSTPAGVPTATLYTAIDDVLERELGGEKRLTTIVDLGVSSIAEAAAVAERKLAELKQQQRRATLGVVGNPGIQLNDRITLSLPGHGVPSADWMVRSVRSDQADQTYLTVLVVEPYTGAY